MSCYTRGAPNPTAGSVPKVVGAERPQKGKPPVNSERSEIKKHSP